MNTEKQDDQVAEIFSEFLHNGIVLSLFDKRFIDAINKDIQDMNGDYYLEQSLDEGHIFLLQNWNREAIAELAVFQTQDDTFLVRPYSIESKADEDTVLEHMFSMFKTICWWISWSE